MALTGTRILTDTKIKQAKPKDKEYKLSDGGAVARRQAQRFQALAAAALR